MVDCLFFLEECRCLCSEELSDSEEELSLSELELESELDGADDDDDSRLCTFWGADMVEEWYKGVKWTIEPFILTRVFVL